MALRAATKIYPTEQTPSSKVFVQQNDELAETIRPFVENLELDSVILEDLALEGAYENKIVHGMGRIPIGWKVVNCDTSAFMPQEVSRDNKYLTLIVSNDCVLDLSVY